MTKSNGIKSLKQAAKLLNKHAPDGESLAYINPEEARLLKAHGGSGIMTLAGVPSYWSWSDTWDTVKNVGKQVLPTIADWFIPPAHPEETDINKQIGSQTYGYPNPYVDVLSQHPTEMLEMANVRDTGSGNFLKDLAKGAWRGIKERYSDPKNIAKDLGTAWLTVETYKGQKDLNEFEQAKYDRALADIAENEAEYASDIGASPLEITGMPSRTDLAQFTETTGRPDMITTPTAAQGGRIGYNFGGIGALNPRMGYQNAGEVENFNWGGPDVVETANMGEEILFNKPLWNRDIQALEKEQTGEFDEIVRQDLMKRVMKYIRDAGGSYKVPERSYWEALSKATEAGDEDVIEYLSQSLYGYPKRVAKQEMPMGAAYGGRIGAQGGGIMPLLNLGGMEKDYRQDGGFVPIGRKEKADDVPARLSKNEFVFTADAVRAAGGGDIDQGAQRMYNVMKNLEAGGDISEQSQGKA